MVSVWEDEPLPDERYSMCAQGGFTFESFLVKDDGVVLWCLRQTEKLASETAEEVQMGRGMRSGIEKT